MTSETDKDIPGFSPGKDQRPRTTLDLTATEIESERTAGAQQLPAGEPGAEGAPSAGDATRTEERADAAEETAPARPAQSASEPGIGGFLTHLAAGLAGAALTLLVAAVIGAFSRGEIERQGAELRRQIEAASLRIAALEDNAKTPRPDAQSLTAGMQELTSQGNALRQDLGALAGRIERLESRPAALSGPSAEMLEQSLQPLNARLGELDGRLSALVKSQDKLRSDASIAAISLALQNLRRAVTEGRPYGRELGSLAAVAPGSLDAAALEARRESGVASQSKLQRDFPSAAKAAIEASREPGDGSFAGDLLAKARSLVRVRPTGDVPGSTPDSILARAEIRLEAGDVPAAIREVEQLQGPAAEAMKGWLAEARARAAAEDAMAQIEARLLAAGTDERARRGG